MPNSDGLLYANIRKPGGDFPVQLIVRSTWKGITFMWTGPLELHMTPASCVSDAAQAMIDYCKDRGFWLTASWTNDDGTLKYRNVLGMKLVKADGRYCNPGT